jgi:hypothetical protein
LQFQALNERKRDSPNAERFDAAFDYKRGASENQAFRRKKVFDALNVIAGGGNQQKRRFGKSFSEKKLRRSSNAASQV